MSASAAVLPNRPLVLVVEDEAGIADVLVAYLRRDGLDAQVARDGPQALEMFRRLRPDFVLLDIQLPGIDGVEVLREIRAESDAPVMMVTARAEDLDKLLALRLGADDYVVKPFSPPEVVARVRAVLRRTGRAPVPAQELIRAGRLEIDLQAHSARVTEAGAPAQELPLTLTEYRLLACLASQPQRCFTRGQLVEACLPESEALDRVIDSHLSKLRRKLALAGLPELIETVRGVGYRLWPAS
ncbi:response regulator [Ramlibacter humi]|uniref:Response regulator transcription factor n=1 Tax=Ramlibacter humi TaxID=2530451 RepID=A0A4Z0CEJ9_9BURK|nr:response regulator [Ramlibacter humi]TFZ08769.1 response regulator transcription factor [Ramlibacter humi]